jgi:AcrR family transcriptional regulator
MDSHASVPSAHHPSHVELGVQTRERLLDAAEDLFAEYGFAATSVRDITSSAGCNLAAVNYHFRGKQNLYGEVFHRRLAKLRDGRIASIRDACQGSGALEEILKAFATAFLEPLVGGSRGRLLMALIAREMLDPHLPAELFKTEFIEPVDEVLVEALIAAVPGLTPQSARLCALEVTGQLLLIAQRKGRAWFDPAWEAGLPPLSEIVAHIARFSAAGVRASVELTE